MAPVGKQKETFVVINDTLREIKPKLDAYSRKRLALYLNRLARHAPKPRLLFTGPCLAHFCCFWALRAFYAHSLPVAHFDYLSTHRAEPPHEIWS